MIYRACFKSILSIVFLLIAYPIVAQTLSLESAKVDSVSNFKISSENGVAVLTWDSVEAAIKYYIYFSETEIDDIYSPEVLRLDSVFADDILRYEDLIVAPHFSFAEDYTSFYAITSETESGESDPALNSITQNLTSSYNYGLSLSNDAIDAFFSMFEAKRIADGSTIKSFFPESYRSFKINSSNRFLEIGEEDTIKGDDDISAKFWIGYDNNDELLIVYAEITDDSLYFLPKDSLLSKSSSFDSWELAIGNYEATSILWSSSHTAYQRGAEPDYLIKTGFYSNGESYLFDAVNNRIIEESLTISEVTDYGYRTATIISTIELSKNEDGKVVDKPFDFPYGYNNAVIYPINLSINDNDSGEIDHQLSWSSRAGDGTWSVNPSKWQGVAFFNYFDPLSIKEEISGIKDFKLNQNYPNPFNPTTEISFILKKASGVKLEVFNILGEKVVTLLNRRMNSGLHSVNFDASNLSSGVYMYRIQVGESIQARKMLLMK
ncbi:MAG: hypothetical protein BalsKO_10950 [Balneolaceae bacterium]